MTSFASEHSGRSAAVTGAGGGLGRDIALGLAAKGYVVSARRCPPRRSKT
jgi:NAD(P)-dependent dehydrogenase (short-subunit alcohol dehydrogenase family)